MVPSPIVPTFGEKDPITGSEILSPLVPMVPQAPSPTVPMVPQAPTFGAQVPAFDYLTAVARTADTITYKTNGQNGEKFVFFLNSNNFIF
jgi:hypothetical protein